MKSLQVLNSRSARITLTALILVLTASCCFAQDPSKFSNLQKHINGHVTIETPDGQVTGQLVRVDENRLVIYQGATPKPIARESVKRVTKHRSAHTGAWIVGMSAAGVGVGLLVGLHAFDDATNANSKVAATAGAAAGGGAAAGYALSRIRSRDQVIYQLE